MQEAEFMALAIVQAEMARDRDEVPIGAVLVDAASGRILAADHNRTEELHDPTAHAEMLVIRAATAAGAAKRLPGADLYVTLEPCAMCAAAISFARLRRVRFAAADPKGGAILHGPRFFELATCHHRPEVALGPLGERSAELLRAFFRARR